MARREHYPCVLNQNIYFRVSLNIEMCVSGGFSQSQSRLIYFLALIDCSYYLKSRMQCLDIMCMQNFIASLIKIGCYSIHSIPLIIDNVLGIQFVSPPEVSVQP